MCCGKGMVREVFRGLRPSKRRSSRRRAVWTCAQQPFKGCSQQFEEGIERFLVEE